MCVKMNCRILIGAQKSSAAQQKYLCRQTLAEIGRQRLDSPAPRYRTRDRPAARGGSAVRTGAAQAHGNRDMPARGRTGRAHMDRLRGAVERVRGEAGSVSARARQRDGTRRTRRRRNRRAVAQSRRRGTHQHCRRRHRRGIHRRQGGPSERTQSDQGDRRALRREYQRRAQERAVRTGQQER